MKFVRLSLVLAAVLVIASLALYSNPRFARWSATPLSLWTSLLPCAA